MVFQALILGIKEFCLFFCELGARRLGWLWIQAILSDPRAHIQKDSGFIDLFVLPDYVIRIFGSVCKLVVSARGHRATGV